jgi:hypothetical protein
MNFFSSQRAHNKKRKRKSAPKTPTIRWHLLGLSDPIRRDSASSIDVIRQGVASLAKGYPLTLQHLEGKPVVRQEPEARRSKKKPLRH